MTPTQAIKHAAASRPDVWTNQNIFDEIAPLFPQCPSASLRLKIGAVCAYYRRNGWIETVTPGTPTSSGRYLWLTSRKSGPGYTSERAQRLRAELIAKLGGKCVRCGATEEIEFDHIHGRDWEPRLHSQLQRLQVYAREIAAGKIQLLCGTCNLAKRDTDKLKLTEQSLAEVPW